ncbi:MAG TPA: uroporphyrinogen decarboxylase [Candidatus Binatia bacterium]|nr:uroporphyrinogen decarboxylase [Candidatus Binatia bacterium]
MSGLSGAAALPGQSPIGSAAARYLRACRRLPVDTTPVWFMRQAGRALPEYRAIRRRVSLEAAIADPALAAEITLLPVTRLGVDAAIVFADITTPLPGLGIRVQLVDGVGPVVEAPVRSAADLDRLAPAIDPGAFEPTAAAIRLVRDASPVPVIGFAGAPFTLACYLVEGAGARAEFPNLRRLMRREPVTVERLLDRLADLAVGALRAQVEAGAAAVQLFDSWVGGLSPADYRRFVRPAMRRLLDGLGDLGVPVTVFGTGTAGLLGEIAATGGDVIGLDWRIDLADGWQRVGEGRAIQGNLDPWLLLGPWPEIEAATRAILAAAGGRPGHIFNLGHGVHPETDPDVLRRLVDLVHEAGSRGAEPENHTPKRT